MNDVFYKYRRDSEYTEALFTSGNVFLSTASGLNDPFECSLQEIGREWIAEKISEMKQAAIAGFVMQAFQARKSRSQFFGLFGRDIKRVLDSIGNKGNVEDAYSAYVQFIKKKTGRAPSSPEKMFAGIDEQLDNVGIFSVSAKPDHPLMWAHYAGDSGICIGFKRILGSKMDDAGHFLPVRYSDELPAMDKDGFRSEMTMSVNEKAQVYTSGFKLAFTDSTFQKAITTKATAWNYEDEWRYVEPYGGPYEWPGALVELTFGLQCLDDRRAHYIRLAEEHVPNPVLLFEMRKAVGSSAMQRVPLITVSTTPRNVVREPADHDVDFKDMKEGDFAVMVERLIQQLRIGEALFQIAENEKRNPNSPLLLSLKGMAYGADQEHEKALECFTALTRVHSDFALGWYQLGCALTQLGKYHDALDALRKAHTLDPKDASTALNIGVLLVETQGAGSEALEFLRRAERLGHRKARRLIQEVEADGRAKRD